MLNDLIAIVPILIVVLSGCAGTSGGPAEEGPESVAASPRPTVAQPAADPTPRTAQRAPAWQAGEWWTLSVTPSFDSPTYEVTRVVAGVEGDNYLVGMPRDAFSHEIMVLHVPGFGLVDQLDLGFEIHDVLFIPIQFPLEEGRRWDTAFEGRPLAAQIVGVDGKSATVRMERHDDQGNLVEWVDAVYDVELGEYRSMTISNYATVEVTDHGFGYEGVVTVPHEHDVIFNHGRIAGAVNAGGGTAAAPPMQEIVVDPTYQRVSFVLILADLDPSVPAMGHYYAHLTAPDGSEYELTRNPGDPPGLTVAMYGYDLPGGTWQAEFRAVGPGIAYLEGIAYHVFDVALPQGCLLPAEGEHAHGDTGCSSGHQGHAA